MFITNLARGGVRPKTAQALAHPLQITLTMDRDRHTHQREQAQAIEALPASQPVTTTNPLRLPCTPAGTPLHGA